MALEEPDTAMSVYKQYLIWKITCIKMGLRKRPIGDDLNYYEKLLREHNIRWAPFES